MKKTIVILAALVIILGASLVYVISNQNEEVVQDDKLEEQEEIIPVDRSNKIPFQDVESMRETTVVKEIFEGVFGENRLFNDFLEGTSYNGDIIYHLIGVYEEQKDMSKYYPEEKYLFNNIHFNIIVEPGTDTRVEMIDLLHYLKLNRITKPDIIDEIFPEDSVMITTAYMDETISERIEEIIDERSPFYITMRVFQEIKPGMNTPDPHQTWRISSDVVEKMDFNDKEHILENIHMYGEFEGVNPAGTQSNQ